jgi:motility quorum-sensing regulator / GCU-specific mRNA interferase toxin
MVYLVSSGKHQPTHDLSAIQAACSDGKTLNITGSAIRDAAAAGYGSNEIVEVIQSIQARHFHKTMASEKVPGL